MEIRIKSNIKLIISGFIISSLIIKEPLFSQSNPEFYRDIYPIIATKCEPCHYKGGPAPFPLSSVEDVLKRSKFIKYVVEIGYMPPWKADLQFQSYKNERYLSDNQKALISKWVDSGTKVNAKSKPKKGAVDFSQVNKVNFTAIMSKEYDIPNNNKDDFRFFYIPTNTSEEKYIRSIRFNPGNKKRVHHSRIMIDTTGALGGIDGMSEYDTKVYEFQKQPLADEFLYGWVPGNFEFKFPKGFGKKLPKNANILLNMHYSPSSIKDKDQSSVDFQLVDKQEIQREVKTLIMRENQISNQPFLIKANEKPTFYMSSGPLEFDLSLLTVQPHAHLIGKSFRTFAITPEGDMIPLIKIDNWDFNWQTTYEFKKLIRIPKGAVIIMEGEYDNTEGNPSNPFFPPQDIKYGWRTVDEMMNLIFYYVDFQIDDEILTLEY